MQPQADGVVFTMKTGTLKILICSDSIVHVLYSPTVVFRGAFRSGCHQEELAGSEVVDRVERRHRDVADSAR